MIFVSYAWADSNRVLPIVELLRQAGLEVWIDLDDIHPASRFMDEILPAIESADTFVFFFTQESAASNFCLREIDAAREFNSLIIPVWLDQPGGPIAAPVAIDGLAGVSHSGQSIAQVGNDLISAIRTDARWLRSRKRLLVAARQWSKADEAADLLFTGRHLAEARWVVESASAQGVELDELEHRYVDASNKAEREQRQSAVQLQQSSLIGTATRLLPSDPRKSIEVLLDIPEPHDSEYFGLLRKSLVALGTLEQGRRIGGGGSVAVSPRLDRWVLTGGGRGLMSAPLSENSQVLGATAELLSGKLIDIAFHPSSTMLCLADDDEVIYTADTDAVEGPDDCRSLKLTQHRAADWLRRAIHNGMVEGIPPLRLIRDPIPTGVSSVAYSPDGQLIAAAHADSTVRIYDAARCRQIHRIDSARAGSFVRFSSSGAYLLSVGGRRRQAYWRWRRPNVIDHLWRVSLIDTKTWMPMQWPDSWPHRPWFDGVLCARLSNDDAWLFLGHDDESYIVNRTNGDYIVVPHKAVKFAEFTPDDRGLITVGSDNTLRGWTWRPSIVTGEPESGYPLLSQETKALMIFEAPQASAVNALTLFANGRWAMVANEQNIIVVYCDVFASEEEIARQAHASRAGVKIAFP